LSRLSCILSALFVATAATALGGCAATFATRAPAAVDLSGEWQIDLVFSDSSQETVPVQDVLAATANDSGTSGSGQAGGRGGRGGRGRGMAGGGMPAGSGQGPGRGGFPEYRFAMPPHLSISQDKSGMTVNITMPDGKRITHAYAAGASSVVSTTRGAANQSVGWDGDDFLIRTKVGDKGPQSDVRYSLDRDGTLAVIATFTNSGIYDFQYTLVYDHVTP
jgi:hypothetical protein